MHKWHASFYRGFVFYVYSHINICYNETWEIMNTTIVYEYRNEIWRHRFKNDRSKTQSKK